MILFAANLGAPVTGAGFQTAATVPIPAGMLLEGVLRWAISARHTTGAGTCQQRLRIGGVDLIAFNPTDGSANIFTRGAASAPPGDPANLRANAMSSRGTTQATGSAAVDLTLAHDLTFEIDLSADTDVYTYDELTVEHLPPT